MFCHNTNKTSANPRIRGGQGRFWPIGDFELPKQTNQSEPIQAEIILVSVVYSAAISWRTLDTLRSVIANKRMGIGLRIEDREDPPPFKTLVVLSNLETFEKFLWQSVVQYKGWLFMNIHWNISIFQYLSSPHIMTMTLPAYFLCLLRPPPGPRSLLSAHIIVDCLKGELSVYYTNYTPATTHWLLHPVTTSGGALATLGAPISASQAQPGNCRLDRPCPSPYTPDLEDAGGKLYCY